MVGCSHSSSSRLGCPVAIIVFVSASVLLALGFGAWSFSEYAQVGDAGYLAYGLASLGVGVALIFYGRAVWKKLQSITKE